MAIKPIEGYYRKAYQDFSGGLNTHDSPLVIKQNQFNQLDNAIVNGNGLLEKAKGYSVDGSPFPDDVDSFIRMLVNYRRGTTVDKLVCAALDEGNTNATHKVDVKETSGDGNYAYIAHTTGTNASFTSGSTAVVGVGTTWLSHLKAGDKIKASSHADAAYTEIASVTNDTNLVLVAGGYLGATAATVAYSARKILNKDFIPTAVVFNNNLIITNGSDTPMSYDNTSLTNITSANAPKGKFIEAHKSRVFIAATSGGPSSIFWSAVNDETSWDAAAFEIVFANDNGNICGIKSFADSLIVLKDNGKIYQVVGSFDQDSVGEPDFIRRIDTPANIGTIAGFTAVVHDNNKLHFLTETGVYALDARMSLEKTSWDIQPTMEAVTLRSGAVSAKSYAYDTKTQWDTGTLTGMRSTTAGDVKNYFDLLTITDFDNVRTGSCSVWIDSSYNIHLAYINTSAYIVYVKWLASDNTSTSTTVVTTGSPTSLSLALAPNGDIGIAYSIPAVYGIQNSGVYFIRYSSSAWSSAELVHQNTADNTPISLQFRSDNIPLIMYQYGSSLYIANRLSGSWATVFVDVGHYYQAICLRLNGSNDIRFATMWSTTPGGSNRTIKYGTGTYDGSDLTYNDSVSTTVTVDDADYLQLELTSADVGISTFFYKLEGVGSRKRNHGTSISSIIDANATALNGGSLNSSDQTVASEVIGSSPTQQEKHLYDDTLYATNATVNTARIGKRVGDRGMHRSGAIFASITPGTNANELLVRRMGYHATYVTPITSDSSLSIWGTYDVTGQTDNGNTVTHAVGVSTTSTIPAPTTITNNSLISTDATKIFIQATITVLMNAFAESVVGSLTLNYTGTGVGAVMPTATVFNNEIYFSVGYSGDAANTGVLLYDRNSTWCKIAYPVMFTAYYRGALYGGASATGKVYKLLQNYRFNASAYTLTAISKEDLLGSLELTKDVYKVYVIFNIQTSGTFDFSYRTDNFADATGSTWHTTSINQTADGIAEVPYSQGLCRSLQFKVESDEIDTQLGVIGWVVLYNYANLR